MLINYTHETLQKEEKTIRNKSYSDRNATGTDISKIQCSTKLSHRDTGRNFLKFQVSIDMLWLFISKCSISKSAHQEFVAIRPLKEMPTTAL